MGVLRDPSTNSFIDGCFDGRTRIFRKKYNKIKDLMILFGGERGIRTLDTLLTYTRFPGVLFQPLRHLSVLRATQFEELNNVL